MPFRVRRLMQKVRLPKDVKIPTAIRAPGLRFTLDNPTGKDKNDFELSLMEAQALMTKIAAKFVGKPFKKVIEVEELLSGDELVLDGDDEQPTPTPPAA